MNKTGKTILDTVLYLVTFVIIQLAIPLILVVGYMHFNPDPQLNFGNILTQNVTLNIASSIIGSLIVIALFIKLGWVSRSRAYLVSRPWVTLTWVAVATIGLIIPAAGLEELLKVELPEQLQLLFTRMMHQPLGYVAIGVPWGHSSQSAQPFRRQTLGSHRPVGSRFRCRSRQFGPVRTRIHARIIPRLAVL